MGVKEAHRERLGVHHVDKAVDAPGNRATERARRIVGRLDEQGVKEIVDGDDLARNDGNIAGLRAILLGDADAADQPAHSLAHDQRGHEFGRRGGQQVHFGIARVKNLAGPCIDEQGRHGLDLVGRGQPRLRAVVPEEKILCLRRGRSQPAKQPEAKQA
jgi:hypothetical protein